MNNLFNAHYKSIVARGLISGNTSIKDFIEKFKEESQELILEYENDMHSDEFKQEAIDCICTLTNMFIHNGYDIKDELIKNIEYQKTRI